MFRTLFACATILAVGAAALSSAFAETPAPSSTKVIQAQVESANTKTSDRTPDNPSPARTPGASLTGAAGTEAAQTPDGTSDRTPSNHYRPPTN